ncbi:unnamed protein product (macronuclear) [Paramecium tetraurelia]|uniref:Myb-like DNA-binding domain protein n=1 Tax=Paramecium tetraurelia TaxID=5888 RepID=A0DL96_PARTE|nr:uncharacterized protein GSPATT00018130001 [Paramecium tetraurelia]CAK83813.1 unnamed protein product [Paramecium tetraurelia]|eukprot:XP_001451210.1 hypothetical protein (macronuclear) [Paramecium tetraurelia strain d4-2]
MYVFYLTQIQEDNALLQNCQQLNFNWKRVSKNMNLMGFKRSGKSCKERFQNQLNPQINKDQWSQNEIDKLFELQIKHGNKWRIIAKELPNRTDGLIKNYFYSLVRKVLRRLSKAINRNKNGSKMTKTLKPSIISQIFCTNQDESKQSTDSLEFAYLFRNIIFKYKNYNLSQQIDNDDIGKIKFIFLTLQKLSESYNSDNSKRSETKINQKQEKCNNKNLNININAVILHKINNKLPIFTTNMYPLENLYKRQDNNFDPPQQINYQAKSSFNTDQNLSSDGFPFKQPQQYVFYHPIPQYYYSMTLNAYIQQQQNLRSLYSSYLYESNKVKQENEE